MAIDLPSKEDISLEIAIPCAEESVFPLVADEILPIRSANPLGRKPKGMAHSQLSHENLL